eukprot:Skav207128  [mRNA]  locus=scaffold554:60898:65263:+ [translate_table: standard]
MQHLSDEEFMAKANVYKQHRLQVAYVQEYFSTRANVVKDELGRLHRLSDPAVAANSESWNKFFSHVWRCGKVHIVDLAGGPGCCAMGAYDFFRQQLESNSNVKPKIEVTVLDPVAEWAWCSEKLGFDFRCCPSMFWQRLQGALHQRAAALGGCNPNALVMVMDRGMNALHFGDHREEVLQKEQVREGWAMGHKMSQVWINMGFGFD